MGNTKSRDLDQVTDTKKGYNKKKVGDVENDGSNRTSVIVLSILCVLLSVVIIILLVVDAHKEKTSCFPISNITIVFVNVDQKYLQRQIDIVTKYFFLSKLHTYTFEVYHQRSSDIAIASKNETKDNTIIHKYLERKSDDFEKDVFFELAGSKTSDTTNDYFIMFTQNVFPVTAISWRTFIHDDNTSRIFVNGIDVDFNLFRDSSLPVSIPITLIKRGELEFDIEIDHRDSVLANHICYSDDMVLAPHLNHSVYMCTNKLYNEKMVQNISEKKNARISSSKTTQAHRFITFVLERENISNKTMFQQTQRLIGTWLDSQI